MIHITKHKYYAEGSRPSHLLALTLKQQEAKRAIPAIRCARKGVVTSTESLRLLKISIKTSIQVDQHLQKMTVQLL